VKIVVFGNSGSGKSTYAMALAARHGLEHLDLDSIVWEPGKIAVQRDRAAIDASLREFLSRNDAWVIEGCYGELVRAAAPHATLLVFLDPGRDVCLENNRQRPWEPHKYASSREQDAMLANLQAWVAGYYDRDDEWSHAAHRAIFDRHSGAKVVHRARPGPGAVDDPGAALPRGANP
jgi:adenylate kinase family enzyme